MTLKSSDGPIVKRLLNDDDDDDDDDDDYGDDVVVAYKYTCTLKKGS